MSDDLRPPSPDAAPPDPDYLAEVRRMVATARLGREVDDELLADYVGGALAGTGVEEQVAELIATRPEWQSAHAAAVEADAAVRADLAHVGASPVAAPPELLSRLADGFRQQAPADHPVVPLDRTRRAARRRRAQWLAGAAAAVVVLAFAGIAGASLLTGGGGNGSARTADSAPHGAAPPTAGAKGPNHAQIAPKDARPADGVRLAASGTDYTAGTLPQARGLAGQQALSGTAAAAVPSALRPLADPARLDRCLHQLDASGASLVDFAMFRSRPAAVVVAPAGPGDQISVVGPECGTDGAHVRYRTTVVAVHAS
ncbi:hypothetical protein AB0I55_10840 [Actinocatenispora sera]|uniref:Uncharacterized protein n=1 Tax=Actinocatenispora sera TaxID=390989 RepID=A0A810KX85_9ACTN|nr:hypothetical protein [Actinocatenispora sera]BCJ27042.1 hypothetical protein Asera_11500 [Actinocatenispora sera]